MYAFKQILFSILYTNANITLLVIYFLNSHLDTFRSTSPYTDITNDGVSVDGDCNDKRSNLRKWMSKKFYERNTKYKNQREELRKKEKRPFKTKVKRGGREEEKGTVTRKCIGQSLLEICLYPYTIITVVCGV